MEAARRRHVLSVAFITAILLAGGSSCIAASPPLSALAAPGLAAPAAPGLVAPAVPDSTPFPARPIRLVVPSEPSGTADVLTRIIAPLLAEDLGQPVVVENKPGPSGILGISTAVRAAPDGYTLLVASAALPAQAMGRVKVPYDPSQDFSPVAPFATIPAFVLVNLAAPFATLADLIASAKDARRSLTYASTGFGSAAHVAGARFGLAIGATLLHVPYRATGPGINDLISGQVDMMFVGLPGNPAYLASARLKALAVAAPDRVPLLPDVPTVLQAGGPEFSVSSWLGILAPRGTPIAVRARLAAAIRQAVRRPEVRWAYAALGALPFEQGIAAFETRYADEIETYRLLSSEYPTLLD
jgi:tripartite-type tricarboxylate transporter receptor subunit TctC